MWRPVFYTCLSARNALGFFSGLVEMMSTARPVGFVLAATEHGMMILNRFDRHQVGDRQWGVGFELLRDGVFSQHEVKLCLSLLSKRRKHFGDGVIAIDGGANIGVHAVEWAKAMCGWGQVYAIEAQERIFYALCGNLAINNCFNAKAMHVAVGNTDAQIPVPVLDYLKEASFGSLELRKRPVNEPVGQDVSYDDHNADAVPLIRIDSLKLSRLDFLKLDVEGMEEEALHGASESIERHLPIMLVERIKSSRQGLECFFKDHGYKIFIAGMSFLAIHSTDPSLELVMQA